jgi:hypothetical protein
MHEHIYKLWNIFIYNIGLQELFPFVHILINYMYINMQDNTTGTVFDTSGGSSYAISRNT